MRNLLAFGLIASGLSLGAWMYLPGLSSNAGPQPVSLKAGAMTLDQAQARSDALLLSVLLNLYSAFEQSDEEAVYDALAQVSSESVLEGLFLQQRATFKEGLGMPTQKIHSVELKSFTSKFEQGQMIYDASWQVFGLVGHGEHGHYRGNIYSADLVVEPLDGQWKLSAFDLTEIKRDDSGSPIIEGAS